MFPQTGSKTVHSRPGLQQHVTPKSIPLLVKFFNRPGTYQEQGRYRECLRITRLQLLPEPALRPHIGNDLHQNPHEIRRDH